jgi:hypothetical protein
MKQALLAVERLKVALGRIRQPALCVVVAGFNVEAVIPGLQQKQRSTSNSPQ